MKIFDLVQPIETLANIKLQEDYDNSGLIVGCYGHEVKKALVALDCTEEVVDEAIDKKCDFILVHHPIIFSGLKKINGRNYIERIIIKAIQNKIAIYAAHTNLDNVGNGVNGYLAKQIGVKNTKILAPKGNMLQKLVVFCPEDQVEQVREAIFKAGAGKIGNYDCCSYNIEGKGSFRALEGTSPYVGNVGEVHFEKEVRIETIFPMYLQNSIVSAMIAAHPYEEVAYDIYNLDNKNNSVGAGLIGELDKAMKAQDFLKMLKEKTSAGCIKHTAIVKNEIKKVALCGGSGSFLIERAKSAKADIFITGDIKYHQFFDAGEKMILADIGHFESEQFTIQLLFDVIKEKFPKFAISISEVTTNPIQYFV